MSTGCNN